MNSVFSNHDEESDEERVVFLDIGLFALLSIAAPGQLSARQLMDRRS